MMDSTQVLELTQALETSQAIDIPDAVPVKVGCLKINGVDYFVWNKENTIGRDDNCDIVIENKAVSVEHAVIEADACGKHLIWDLGSTNKTRLGEVQLKPRVRHYLNDGARLRFANVNAVYHHIKVIPPRKPPPLEPIGLQIPGTPERAEEDAAIASIVAETPSKMDDNDASSDGDFFGEHDSSSIFMRPLKLLEDCSALPDAQNSLLSPPATSASTINPVQFDPVGEALNESSICGANSSVADETDISDVIAGSQPLLTPQKALNIYEIDTVPMDRVEETPVKASENDVVDWDNIDDSIHEISQEMDTIDTLIEKKELCVKFTPPKRGDSSVGVASVADRPTAFRNLGSYGESSPNRVASLHSKNIDIYDLETEPMHVGNNKIDTADNIFDLATQAVAVSNEEDELEADISVYDLATQPFFDPDSKISKPDLVDVPSPSCEKLPTADVSISDLPTQVTAEMAKPIVAKCDRSGEIPPSAFLRDAVSESVDSGVLVRNGESAVDDSLCDTLTQAAPTDAMGIGKIAESPLKMIVGLPDMATQPSNRSEMPLGVRERHRPGHSLSKAEKATPVLDPNIQLDSERNLADVSISDLATQQAWNCATSTILDTELTKPSRVAVKNIDVPMLVDPPNFNDDSPSAADISMSDLQTQVAGKGKIVSEKSIEADVSISDLQTQVAEMPKDEQEESIVAEISIADMQTQMAQIPECEPEELKVVETSISDLQTQVASIHEGGPGEPNIAEISIADLHTQAAESPKQDPEELNLAEVTIVDLQTQVAESPKQDSVGHSVAELSIADLQTQVGESPKRKPEDNINTGHVKMSTLPTQVEPNDVASLDTSKHQDQLPNLSTDDGVDDPKSEDIYNVMTQMSVPQQQIMCEESDTQKIVQEVDLHEKKTIDRILGKSSDSSNTSLDPSVSPFKSPISSIPSSKLSPLDAHVNLLPMGTQAVPIGSSRATEDSHRFEASERSETSTSEQCKQLACKPPQVSVYDVDTEDPGMVGDVNVAGNTSVYDVETLDFGSPKKASNPGETSVYDVETQDVASADRPNSPAETSVYDVETQDVASAEKPSNLADTSGHDVEVQNLRDTEEVGNTVRASAESKNDATALENASVQDKSVVCKSHIAKHRYSQDLDANSVENRIMAMNVTNVNPPVVQKGCLNAKSTVAELLETLEGTPCLKGDPRNPHVSNLSEQTVCSQFPKEKSLKTVKALTFTDSEDSNDSPVFTLSKDKKSLSDQIEKFEDSDVSQSSNAQCSQFPVEKVQKKVKSLVFSDTEDSCDSSVLEQKKPQKPLGAATDRECAIPKSKEEIKTVVAGPELVCNGISKEDLKERKLSKAESSALATASNNSSDIESLRLQLSDSFMNVTEERSREVCTPERLTDRPNASSSNMQGTATSVSKSIERESNVLHTPPKSTEQIKSRRKSPQVSPSSPIVKSSQDTPEIPKDFFLTPLMQERPPLRQYVNRKKLSLNASSLLKGPNASSTPLSEKDSHSVIDMEETLLTPKHKTAKTPTENIVQSHRDDDSEDFMPKNVKRFKKSPIKKPSQHSLQLSQDSETHSSQEESADSQELGRGKRKRLKKSFFGFDDKNDESPEALSPKPSSIMETNIATSSKTKEDSTQHTLDVSSILQESVEADAPRRERPRKQAFMSCESNEARSTMERYRNDTCYAQSQKLVDASSAELKTITVRQDSVSEIRRSSVEMDLIKIKSSLKASLARGQESENSQTPEKLAEIPKSAGKILSPGRNSHVLDSERKSEKNKSLPPSIESDLNISVSPVRKGRGRPAKTKSKAPVREIPEKKGLVEEQMEKIFSEGDGDRVETPLKRGRKKREVSPCAKPLRGITSQGDDVAEDKLPEATIEPDRALSKAKVRSTSSQSDVITHKQTISKRIPSNDHTPPTGLNDVPVPVMPTRGRRRKENTSQERLPTTTKQFTSAEPSENYPPTKEENRRNQPVKNLDSPNSQMEQDSQSSVSSKNNRTRSGRNTPLSLQGPETSTSTAGSRGKRRRKLSGGSQILESSEVIDDENAKMPPNNDGKIHGSDPTVVKDVLEKSAPLKKRGRPRKPVACSTPVPEPAQEPSITELPISKSGLSSNLSSQQDQNSQPASTSPIRRATRKRGNADMMKTTEKVDQSVSGNSKTKAISGGEHSEKNDNVETRGIQDDTSNYPASRKKAEAEGPSSETQPIVSTSRRRGDVQANEALGLLEGSEDPALKEIASGPRKTRGRPRKAVVKPVDDSIPTSDELSATEVPSVSKKIGRRKIPVETSAEDRSRLESAAEEVIDTEVPSVPKARGRPRKAVTPVVDHRLLPAETFNTPDVPSPPKPRGRRPKKAVEELTDEDCSSQDLSQGRRSGRARKKKESFDDLVARKEEEIRLKKLQRTAEMSPSQDKSHRLLMTPSASVASVSDESAFSIPASPASSISSKRSASQLGTPSSDCLPSSSKKKKKEELTSAPPSVQMKVMFTQLDDNKLSAMVKKLGGKVVEKPKDCSVLVTDKVKRTVKFLCALGLGKPIVTPNWVSKSKAFSQFVDPNDCLLKDDAGEAKFDFELSSSLERAKSQRLLEGYSVYTTASIMPPPKEMKPIIECSGGTFLTKPPAKWGPQHVVISDPKDQSDWSKLTKNGVTPPILSAEAVLSGVLQQRFDLEKHRLK